jgi:hypothetical protein
MQHLYYIAEEDISAEKTHTEFELSDGIWYSANSHLAAIISEVVGRLWLKTDGCPARMLPEDYWQHDKSMQEAEAAEGYRKWKEILDKIMCGFRLYAQDHMLDEEDDKVFQEAKKLFCEYFEQLWD